MIERRAILVAALLALVTGCGEPTPASLSDKGLKELRSGQYDEAIATCTDAVRLDPRDDAAYLYRGRAYHFRNAKGDAQRALADFTRAIEIDPKSSDAYYSRALVYRDIGQNDLAAADDNSARQLDGHLQALDRRLPEPLPLPVDDTPREAAADATASSAEPSADAPVAPKQPELSFGTLRIERNRSERPRESKPPTTSETQRDPPQEPGYVLPRLTETAPGDPAARDLRSFRPLSPLAPQGQSNQNPTQRRAYRPTPTSPFQARGPSALDQEFAPPLESPFGGPVRSPFGQRAPAPTGFTREPVGPFVPQATGRQPAPPVGNPFSNPAVRPPNPRDYVP
jgi:hypothetical protein